MTSQEETAETEPAERLFGTDGIRGAFGEAPLDRLTVERAVHELVLGLRAKGVDTPHLVGGGDTRESTPTLAAWVDSAIRSAGGVFAYAGVIPTPGVAWLVDELGCDAGVVISASHNPYPDNGIKFFDEDGFKPSVDFERELERRIAASRHQPTGGAERVDVDATLVPRYARALADSISSGDEQPLAGLRVALDTGNGAAYELAEPLFTGAGAVVVIVGDRPNGRNVNQECGSTHPDSVASTVLTHQCDLGFSFDGDADRVVLCDERGKIHGGDEVLWVWARELHRDQRLPGSAIVATTLSNLGLDRALSRHGIDVVRCDVGDRQVVETLRERGLVLGGEPSGHFVHLAAATTGDGLRTALDLAKMTFDSGGAASELFAGFETLPQTTRNVVVDSKPELGQLPAVAAKIREIERQLEARGRLVLRYSGTEPLARVMIEGIDPQENDLLADGLAAAIEREIGIGGEHE